MFFFLFFFCGTRIICLLETKSQCKAFCIPVVDGGLPRQNPISAALPPPTLQW